MTDTITYLPLSALRESPFNPRQFYPQAELDELADSLKTQRMLQPIVARVLPQAKGDLYFTYEIIFGHRRFRAAALAGLDPVPVVTREMTDAEAALAQVHENAKRTNPNAIEEADSYAHLSKVHKMSADAIAEATGKSKAYVYARLKIAKTAPEVRVACSQLGLAPESALEIARHLDHNLQRAALKACENYKFTASGKERDGWVSVREAQRIVRGMFDTDLDEAPFEISDAKLYPKAGSCVSCPRRAGNDIELQGVVEPSTCTDKKCYEIKVTTFIESKLAAARKAGQTIIEGDAALAAMPTQWGHTLTGYTDLHHTAFYEPDPDDADHELDVSVEAALERAGAKAPKVQLLVNPHKPGEVLQVIADEEVEALAALLAPSPPNPGSSISAKSAWPFATGNDQRKLTPEHDAVWSGDTWAAVQLAMMKRVMLAPRSTDELRAVLERELEYGDDFGDDAEALLGFKREDGDDAPDSDEQRSAWLTTLSADQLGQLLVMVMIQSFPYGRQQSVEARCEKRIALARQYGIDVLDPTAEVQTPANAAPTPSKAARAAKGAKAAPAAAGAKKPVTAKQLKALAASAKKGKDQKDDAGAAGGSVQADLLEGAAA